MSKKEIKPCPFCGKKVIIEKDNHDKMLIECENCKLFFGIEVENGTELVEGWRAAFDSVEEIIDKWNRRADTEMSVTYGDWVYGENGYAHCSECDYEHNSPEYVTPFCPGCGARMEDDKE